jgi:hypothetical protein
VVRPGPSGACYDRRVRAKRWLKRLLLVAALGIFFFIFGFVPYFLAGAFTVRSFQMQDA